jgi:hypothetical protein
MMVRVTMAVVVLAAGAAVAAPVAKPIAIKPAAPPPDAAKLADALRELGQRTLAHLPTSVTGGDARWIAAVGACDRPSPDEVAALTQAVAKAWRQAAHMLTLRVGCKDPGGTIAEVQTDLTDPRQTGARRFREVVRIAGDAVAQIEAKVKNHPKFGRWNSPTLLDAVALADLDGDGVRDVVIAQASWRDQHDRELWLAASKEEGHGSEAFQIGTITGDAIEVAAGQPSAGHPPPLIFTFVERAYSDEPTYRCIVPPGKLELCPAVEPARRFAAARAIATAWAQADPPAIDRDALAEQMLALAPFGVTAADRSRVLPLAAPAAPTATIAREVARVLDRRVPRRFGEPVYPVIDPRPARALAMLGDAPCPALAGSEGATASARIRSWLVDQEPRLRIELGDCQAGAACRWTKHPAWPRILDACVAPGQAYYVATWRDSAPSPTGKDWLVRTGVFHDRAGTLRLVAIASATAPIDPACDPASARCVPVPALEARMYRRGTSVIARIQQPAHAAIDVDGAAVAPPAAGADEPYRIGHEAVIDLVGVAGASAQFFHWEGAWKPIATPGDVHPRTPPPTLDPQRDAVALWLWQQARFDSALDLLRHFTADAWQASADVRADVHQALVILGADPASQARANAAEIAAGK